MEGIITWNIFLVGFLTELCLYILRDVKKCYCFYKYAQTMPLDISSIHTYWKKEWGK